ncbi:relaxase, partial [Enterococcus faecium]
ASIRETAQEGRREQRTLTTAQPQIRRTRNNHDQHVERGADYQQELSF